jgi:hypothetical protein
MKLGPEKETQKRIRFVKETGTGQRLSNLKGVSINRPVELLVDCFDEGANLLARLLEELSEWDSQAERSSAVISQCFVQMWT